MADGAVVGSAEFELRATRAKIQGDMEAARREVAEAAKRTEAELEGIVGTGTAKGAKKAAEALKEPKQAGIEAGAAIRDSMKKAGDEIAESIGRGARKAKADLESVAQKAREVQKVKLPTPTVPTEATHRLVTNPINGTQSWVPKMDPAGGVPSQSAPTTAVLSAATPVSAVNSRTIGASCAMRCTGSIPRAPTRTGSGDSRWARTARAPSLTTTRSPEPPESTARTPSPAPVTAGASPPAVRPVRSAGRWPC